MSEQQTPRTSLRVRRMLRARLSGIARAVAYALLFSALLAVVGVHRARGAVGKSVLALGSEAMKLVTIDSETNRLRVNGEELSLLTASVDLPLDRVLDELEEVCNVGGASSLHGVFEQALKLDPSAQDSLAQIGVRPGSNAFRFEEGQSGVVLCFVTPDGAPRKSLLETLEAVSSTGQLGAFGTLRYFFVQRGSERTEIIALWSSSPLSLSKLTGGDGSADVEGIDPVHIARPPASRRTFSVSVVGSPYNYNLYSSAESPAAILKGYDDTMRAQGFERLIAPGLDDDPSQRVYIKPMLMVLATAAGTSEGTVVALMESDNVRTPALPRLPVNR
jgi:hypothetical protein